MLQLRDALFCVLLVCSEACLGFGAGTARARGLGQSHPRQIQGRFLHITDFHLDPFYKTYSSTEEDAACHRKRGPAGVYGAETSACDSSLALVNATMAWVEEHLADEIDFVIWTGDSARHDNDEKIPRTEKQVVQQNEFLVQKFTEVFGKDDNINDTDPTNDFKIPIVPTFGNNDILPHNILLAGPNKWTRRYLDIWRSFIPEAQRHQFQQGGWFHMEVIPGKLAVVSLNTMYFFTSNSGVDGCANKHEPGYEQFEWLRIQLQIFRDRGMKAILMGHVPPARVDSKESWDETCWQKFTLWQRQYRDVIVGSLFGHMNIDHFMLQDFKQLKKKTKKGVMKSASKVKSMQGEVSFLEDGEVTVASASDYLLDLRQAWAKLPSPPSKKDALSISEYIDAEEEEEELSLWQWIFSGFSKPKKGKKGGHAGKSAKKKYLNKIGGKYAERYSVGLVSPSVVPNYFPTLRIFEYNITGLEGTLLPVTHNQPKSVDFPLGQLPMTDTEHFDHESYLQDVKTIVNLKKKKKEKDTFKKPKNYKFKVPKGPSKSSLPGPAYSPQPFTLLGYTQYFANLTHINNDFVVAPESLPSHSSSSKNSPHTIFGLDVDEDGSVEGSSWKEGKHHQHQGKQPRPKPHPKKFRFEVEYDTRTDKRFGLKDLTVRSFVDLARRIGKEQEGSHGVWSDGEDVGDEFNDEESDFEQEDEDDEVEEMKKGKKHKHKKGKKKHGKNSAWFTFVKRAFVGTMDPRDIEELFGARAEEGVDVGESMEL